MTRRSEPGDGGREMKDIPELERACRAIAADAANCCRWEWAESLPGILAVIRVQDARTVERILAKNFARKWTSADAGEATGAVKNILARLDGIRGGQFLYVSVPEQDPMLFAAWWPWSDGASISIRLGCETGSPDAVAGLNVKFKRWFIAGAKS
jgi:hypothetical protein